MAAGFAEARRRSSSTMLLGRGMCKKGMTWDEWQNLGSKSANKDRDLATPAKGTRKGVVSVREAP